MTIRTYNAATGEWTTSQEDAPSFEPVLTPAEQLTAWRATASLHKADFCIGLNHLGVLSKSDMKAASKGDWPSAFTAALAGLPIDPDEAEAIWGATTTIARLHPILVALIPQSPLTDQQVDAMFGRVAT